MLHRAAKLLIAHAIREWRAGRHPAPVVVRYCALGLHQRTQPLPARVNGVLIEHRLADGLVADVALASSGQPVALVEILVTHEVDAEKAGRLDLPWIELGAESVLADPWTWRPTKDRFRPFDCEPCEANRRDAEAQDQWLMERAEKRAREEEQRRALIVFRIARARGTPRPPKPFEAFPQQCRGCKKWGLLVTWPNFFGPDRDPPPITNLPWLRRTTDRSFGERWESVCLHCNGTITWPDERRPRRWRRY